MLDIGFIVKDYKVLAEIKGGAQGFVYIVENVKTHEHNVLKSMFIEESRKSEFVKMVEMWKLLCVSKERFYFVEYKEHFFEKKSTMIVMEYCNEGDLDTLIKKRILEEKKFTQTEILKLVIEGMSALNEMHTRNFIHRDIKSGNILIGADGKYKMSDFNSSKLLEGTKGASTFTGTLEFAPPEIVRSEEYSFSVDVYSFGVVLYQMMVGKTPFVNERGVNMMNIMTGKYEPINPTLGYSQPLVDLVHACLSVDPAARPTAAAVLGSAIVSNENVRLETEAYLLGRAAEMVREAVREVTEAGRTERQRLEQRVAELEDRMAEEKRNTEREIKRLAEEIAELKRGAANNAVFSFHSGASPPPPSSSVLSTSSASSVLSTPSASSVLSTPSASSVLSTPSASFLPTELAFCYLPNPSMIFNLSKRSFRFARQSVGKARSVFLDYVMKTKGIYSLKIAISNFWDGHSVRIGVTEVESLNNLHSALLGDGEKHGVGLIISAAETKLANNGSLTHVKSSSHALRRRGDSVEVTVEVDLLQHILRFSLRNESAWVAVSEIPASIVFGYSSRWTHDIRVVSLQQLAKPSAVAANAKTIKWKK